MNVEVFLQTLVKIYGNKEGVDITLKIEKRCDKDESRIIVTDPSGTS